MKEKKGRSIQSKILVWYTGLIVLLLLFLFLFLAAYAEQVVVIRAKMNLEAAVRSAGEDIEYEHGQMEIDDDFKMVDKGIFLSAYQNNTFLAGSDLAGFPQDVAFESGNLRTIARGEEKWMVYDAMIGNDILIRGVYPFTAASSSMAQMILMAMLLFPFIIIVAAFGGYLITKNAFAPMKKMMQTAQNIGGGNDLSKRIHLKNNGNEVGALAKTFDDMLDRLEKAFEGEKQFTSDVSHELRTPIAVLTAQSEYALSQPNDSEEIKKALTIIREQTGTMSLLISQLLEISRAENQASGLQMEKVNISELLEMIVQELTAMADKNQITLHFQGESNRILICEQTLMMRLFINLITNGIKYTKEQGCVEVKLWTEKNNVVICVSDNGIGIEKEHLDKIFRRFYQVDSARTHHQDGGFGLGLAMCEWIVRAHHGQITVQSQIGTGSSFTVILPPTQNIKSLQG